MCIAVVGFSQRARVETPQGNNNDVTEKHSSRRYAGNVTLPGRFDDLLSGIQFKHDRTSLILSTELTQKYRKRT